jgi:hypothetical protein
LELFYPEIQLEKPSKIRGNINTNTNEFKLFCNAEQINVDKNKLFNLKLELDNKNPVYNAYITLDSIQNKRYTISDFNLLHKKLKTFLAKRNIFIDDVFYCPHHPYFGKGIFKKNCFCRKPNNLLVANTLGDWPINRNKSFMIGDKYTDKICADLSRIKFFYYSNSLCKEIKLYEREVL